MYLRGVGDHSSIARLVEFRLLESRGQHSHTDGLAQDQNIAGLGVSVTAHAVRVHQAHDNEAVDGLDGVNRVATSDRNASLSTDGIATSQNAANHLDGKLADGHRNNG